MRSRYEIENIFLAGLYTPSRKLMALNAETWTDEETAHVAAIKETICNGDTEDAVLARYEDEDKMHWIHAFGHAAASDLITIGKVQPDNMTAMHCLPSADFAEAVKVCTSVAREINEATVAAEQELNAEAVPNL
jgi:hypothetical protein